MRRVLLALSTAVALVAALFTITTAPAGAALGLVTDLAVEVSADKAQATIDETVTYTVTATNVSLAVPSGGTLTSTQTGVGTIQSFSADPGVNCSRSGQQISCALPTLNPGQSAAIAVTVGSSTAGFTTNTSSVSPSIGILDLDQSDNTADSTTSYTDGGTRLAPGECIETEGHELCNTGSNDIVVTDFEQTTTATTTPVCDTAPCPVVFLDFAKNPDVQGVATVDVEYGVPDPPCRGTGQPCAVPTLSKDGEEYAELEECASETDTECYTDIYKSKRGVWHFVIRLSTQDPLIPILGV